MKSPSGLISTDAISRFRSARLIWVRARGPPLYGCIILTTTARCGAAASLAHCRRNIGDRSSIFSVVDR